MHTTCVKCKVRFQGRQLPMLWAVPAVDSRSNNTPTGSVLHVQVGHKVSCTLTNGGQQVQQPTS